MLLPVDQLGSKIGKRVLFIGVEACTWSIQDIQRAARNARAMGFDTICIKRADGQNKYYVTPGHLQLERQACLSEGVGFVAFGYFYGPRFGDGQIAAEAAIAKEMGDVCDHMVVMDLEVEWDGQVAAAHYLAQCLQGWHGDVIISTWADPNLQNWNGVVEALKPVVTAWGPQEYTDWLCGQEGEFEALSINQAHLFPAFDISGEYGGATHPLQEIQDAKGKHYSYWIWEYQCAVSNPELVKGMLSIVGAPLTNIIPTPLPHKPTKGPQYGIYTVVAGDTLSAIGERLGIVNWFQNIFLPNKSVLDTTARNRGYDSSQNGNIIFPGEVLRYVKAG